MRVGERLVSHTCPSLQAGVEISFVNNTEAATLHETQRKREKTVEKLIGICINYFTHIESSDYLHYHARASIILFFILSKSFN